ncbi:DUF2955 domain-containing protein [Marinihelvus fidelis]|nr:DUF2955 domain-containing protein [Marinihelvus fidelis]
MHPVAVRRIYRLAAGSALSLVVSQVMGISLPFVAPVLTFLLLGLPVPAPGLKKGLGFVIALIVPMLGATFMLPFLEHARWAGIGLVTLALFYTFYFTARGGPAVLGTFMTIGITVVVTIGSVNTVILMNLIQAFAANALVGVGFVWVAHWLLPDLPGTPVLPKPPKAAPDYRKAGRSAIRSLLVVLPLVLLFLFSSASAAYTPVMIKVASMGQQATVESSRSIGLSLLESTWWGGVAAMLAWCLLTAWPSIIMFTLLTLLAGLVFGRFVFSGIAVNPDFSKWTYAFVTMLVLIGPAVTDSPLSDGVSFGMRLWLFMVIAVYGTVAVRVFDAFFKPESNDD